MADHRFAGRRGISLFRLRARSHAAAAAELYADSGELAHADAYHRPRAVDGIHDFRHACFICRAGHGDISAPLAGATPPDSYFIAQAQAAYTQGTGLKSPNKYFANFTSMLTAALASLTITPTGDNCSGFSTIR